MRPKMWCLMKMTILCLMLPHVEAEKRDQTSADILIPLMHRTHTAFTKIMNSVFADDAVVADSPVGLLKQLDDVRQQVELEIDLIRSGDDPDVSWGGQQNTQQTPNIQLQTRQQIPPPVNQISAPPLHTFPQVFAEATFTPPRNIKMVTSVPPVVLQDSQIRQHIDVTNQKMVQIPQVQQQYVPNPLVQVARPWQPMTVDSQATTPYLAQQNQQQQFQQHFPVTQNQQQLPFDNHPSPPLLFNQRHPIVQPLPLTNNQQRNQLLPSSYSIKTPEQMQQQQIQHQQPLQPQQPAFSTPPVNQPIRSMQQLSEPYNQPDKVYPTQFNYYQRTDLPKMSKPAPLLQKSPVIPKWQAFPSRNIVKPPQTVYRVPANLPRSPIFPNLTKETIPYHETKKFEIPHQPALLRNRNSELVYDRTAVAFRSMRDVGGSFVRSAIVPDLFATAPKTTLEVTLSDGTYLQLGNRIEDIQTVIPPTEIKWDAENSFKFYTLMLIAVGPQHQTDTTLHWMVYNIGHNDPISRGNTIVEYMPVPSTKIGNRAVFVLYEQSQFMPDVGFTFVPGDESTLDWRRSFDIHHFTSINNFGLPFAGNFYVAAQF